MFPLEKQKLMYRIVLCLHQDDSLVFDFVDSNLNINRAKKNVKLLLNTHKVWLYDYSQKGGKWDHTSMAVSCRLRDSLSRKACCAACAKRSLSPTFFSLKSCSSPSPEACSALQTHTIKMAHFTKREFGQLVVNNYPARPLGAPSVIPALRNITGLRACVFFFLGFLYESLWRLVFK